MKPAEQAQQRLKAIPLSERMKLISRNDVPVDLMDAIQGELSGEVIADIETGAYDRTQLDLRLYLAIKNYLAHKIDSVNFAQVFPESKS